MVVGGYIQVPHAYAYGLKDSPSPLNIQYNKNVVSVNIKSNYQEMEDIEESPEGLVKIVCQDGTIIRCDAVVMTPSVGVLKVALDF